MQSGRQGCACKCDSDQQLVTVQCGYVCVCVTVCVCVRACVRACAIASGVILAGDIPQFSLVGRVV